ncbi:MAG TPA: rhodanese-like domain-containing protein, partial [Stellaceae bacterium]|nr:rhodanese-like domain-containing protein [Stellaceae bacterium]
IIGAQSLINAGVPNRVVALKNGTMGWHLAGLTLAHGETRHAGDPSPEGIAKARTAASDVARRAGVRAIDRETLQRFRREHKEKTLYVFDVRTPEEYVAGHLAGARSAPGGQLVQATDAYMATRSARVVLVDREGVRAPMTGSWLRQMGLEEVYVLDRVEGLLETGPEVLRYFGRGDDVPMIGPKALAPLVAQGEAVVVDLEGSLAYRERHIPGAWFAIRARLDIALPRLPERGMLVLTSRDGDLAALAVPDLAALTERPVKLLSGGTNGWARTGLPLVSGEEHMADAPIDAWYRPYDKGSGVEAAMNAYLSWEVALVEQIARDGDARFRTLAPR